MSPRRGVYGSVRGSSSVFRAARGYTDADADTYACPYTAWSSDAEVRRGLPADVLASPVITVSDRVPQWLEPSPPWLAPVPAALCAGLTVAPGEVPVVEVLSAPCSLAEVIAVRAGRYVPLFGVGTSREEALRAFVNVVRALGADADPRGSEHALAMAVHPGTGRLPLLTLAEGTLDGSAAAWWAEMAVAYVTVLGASDQLRERVAQDVAGHRSVAIEVALALGAGGGDFGTFREHYAALTTAAGHEAAPVRVARAWFDFVLARRFAGLDALHALKGHADLDPASRWLVATADLVNGDESARGRMAQHAEDLLASVRHLLPRLVGIVAREMAELVRHPLALRFHHLRAAVARDHAAVAIRAWLVAAAESDAEESLPEPHAAAPLGPEPTRAGRAAIEARAIAGEFLLDWFVSDREAREAVDSFARRVLRLYHRLRGAQLFARVERELRPPGGMLTALELIAWGPRASPSAAGTGSAGR
jgi:hypothetical protein